MSLGSLADRVNRRLGREDLTGVNMAAALDQIPARRLRGWFLKEMKQGEVHYRDGYVLDRLFGMVLECTEGVEEAPSLPEGTEVVGTFQIGSEGGVEAQSQQEGEELFSGEVFLREQMASQYRLAG